MSNKVKDEKLEKVSGGNGQNNPKYAKGDYVFIPGSMSQSILYIENVYWSDYNGEWYYEGTRRYANGNRDKQGAPESKILMKAPADAYGVMHFWD